MAGGPSGTKMVSVKPSVISSMAKPKDCGRFGIEDSVKDCEGVYHGGLKSDLWTYWHANGRLDSQGVFLRNQEEGPWTSWYSNEQPEESGGYRTGQKSGPWKYWDGNGERLL